MPYVSPASVFVRLYQLLRQYLYVCTRRPPSRTQQLQLLRCQYLYFCAGKASKLSPSSRRRRCRWRWRTCRRDLCFCTSKASKVSTSIAKTAMPMKMAYLSARKPVCTLQKIFSLPSRSHTDGFTWYIRYIYMYILVIYMYKCIYIYIYTYIHIIYIYIYIHIYD